MKLILLSLNLIFLLICIFLVKDTLNAYSNQEIDFSSLECQEKFDFQAVSQGYKGKSFYDKIARDTLFPPEKEDEVKESKVDQKDMEAIKRKALQNLRLELKGIILSTPSKVVIFDKKNGLEGFYKVKDEISGAILLSIESNRIILDYNGYEFELKLFEDTVNLISLASERKEEVDEIEQAAEEIESYQPQNIGGRYTVTRAELFRQALSFSRILKSVSIQPIKIADKIQFYQINDIDPQSFVYSMGMRSGDILHSVNGTQIDSFQKALEVGRNFKDSSQIFVKVLRNNNEVTLMYDVE